MSNSPDHTKYNHNPTGKTSAVGKAKTKANMQKFYSARNKKKAKNKIIITDKSRDAELTAIQQYISKIGVTVCETYRNSSSPVVLHSNSWTERLIRGIVIR